MIRLCPDCNKEVKVDKIIIDWGTEFYRLMCPDCGYVFKRR